MIKDNLEYTLFDSYTSVVCIFCKVKVGTTKFTIGNVYRPLGSDIALLCNFESYVPRRFNADFKLIITGDFNLSRINWQPFAITHPNARNAELLQGALGLNLTRIVTSATKICSTCSSLINLAFVNNSIPQCPDECKIMKVFLIMKLHSVTSLLNMLPLFETLLLCAMLLTIQMTLT